MDMKLINLERSKGIQFHKLYANELLAALSSTMYSKSNIIYKKMSSPVGKNYYFFIQVKFIYPFNRVLMLEGLKVFCYL